MPQQPYLYHFGYLNPRAPRILNELLAVRTPIVDIRYSTASKRYEWTREALERKLGSQYVWIQTLGNELYREALDGHFKEPRIQLHNVESGLAQLADILEQHGRAALMCACTSPKHCHRTNVARLAQAQFGVQVYAL